MKELKYRKNSKFEIEFTNLDKIKEGDDVVLRLKNSDLSPLFYLDCEFTKFKIFFICGIFNDYQLQQITPILKNHNECIFYFFDIDNFELFLQIEKKNNFVNSNVQFKNICPKWNISKDNAILFLNKRDQKKYENNYKSFWICNLESDVRLSHQLIRPKSKLPIIDEFINYKTISIIVPELHAEDKNCPYHIDNINNVCKELKEKYGVERIELFVSHCFVKRKYKYTRCAYSSYELDYKFDNWNKYDFDLKKDFNNKPIEKNSFIPIVSETIVNDNTIEFKVEKEYELTKSIECDKRCKCSKLELSAVGLMIMDDFNPLHDNGEEFNYGDYIDKITTTNSTGILEVQKSDKLEVIDVMEFFKD